MSKNTQDITVETFEELIKKPGILMLDFWATWCPPCRMFGPIFETAAGKHTDITWGKIDTDAQQDLARAFHVQSIPTLIVFRDGIMVFEQAGALPAAALEKVVEAIRGLDMEEVRSKAKPMHEEQG